MSSEIEISNIALLMLGDSPIISFDDGSERANLCNAFYPTIRDEVLRAHPWNCARVRVQLVALAAAPVYEYDYQYQLPASPYCLKVLDVNENTTYPWKIEGRKLLTDESEVYITYTGRVDVGDFDVLLMSAISRRLAAQLTYAITAKFNLFEMMWKAYELVLSEARSVDSQEGSAPSFLSNDLIDVRG
jgi:hypothetical protein